VKVTREVGSGYDDRWQAAAAARMTASEAVLVRARDNKWHACATSANAYGGMAAADNGDIREIVPLTSYQGIVGAKRTGSDEAHFASVLGLREGEVKPQRSSLDREARFVNVNPKLAYPGVHGPERQDSERFDPNAPTAIELRRSLFDGDPRMTNAVLFHEASHRADYALAQRWAKAYRATGGGFDDSRAFVQWLFKRDGLSRDDAQTVADVIAKAHGSTEARAYVGTFIAAMQAGAYDAARDQLVTYAKGLSRGDVPRPVGEIVPTALRSDLDNAYRALDATGRTKMKDTIDEAKKHGKGTWLVDINVGAARRS
jgi:hypothetical protein